MKDPLSDYAFIYEELFSNPKIGNPIVYDVFKMRLQTVQRILTELPVFIQLGDYGKSYIVKLVSVAKESLRFCERAFAKFEQDQFLESYIIDIYRDEVDEAKKKLSQYGMM